MTPARSKHIGKNKRRFTACASFDTFGICYYEYVRDIGKLSKFISLCSQDASSWNKYLPQALNFTKKNTQALSVEAINLEFLLCKMGRTV